MQAALENEFERLCNWRGLRNLFDLAWRLFEINPALVSPDGEKSLCFDKDTQQAAFCLALQHGNIGQHLCDECDRRYLRQAAEKLVPLRYRCHAGLTEFIVPVVRQGRLIALLQCGQVFDTAPSDKFWRNTESKLHQEAGINLLEPLFYQNRVLSPARQGDLMQFLNMIAEHLAHLEDVHLNTPASRNQELISRVTNYVESHLEEPLPLKDIARAVAVSSRSLCRAFKAETGATVLDFVIGRRIARACHYLGSSDRACIEIAFAVGFRSVQNFNRTFRKLKSCTPRAWRLEQIKNWPRLAADRKRPGATPVPR